MSDRVFEPDKVVESFKLGKILALHSRGKLYDFLDPCKTQSPEQMAILNSWKKHFIDCDIPWAVTEHDSTEKITKRAKLRILWKELIAGWKTD